MDRLFVFGGVEYKCLEKKVLRGMDCYYVLENVQTRDKLYLYCLAD